jgi:small subunit ribosomal protein S4
MADRKKGVTVENLLQLLEMRFDNVIYRLGFAGSRNQARQMIRHRFFTINGRKVNVPSYILKQGDTIAPADNKKEKPLIKTAIEGMKGKTLPSWLAFDADKNQGLVQTPASREDITLPIQEQLIVELYSR